MGPQIIACSLKNGVDKSRDYYYILPLCGAGKFPAEGVKYPGGEKNNITV
jgi:hypothetical protein